MLTLAPVSSLRAVKLLAPEMLPASSDAVGLLCSCNSSSGKCFATHTKTMTFS